MRRYAVDVPELSDAEIDRVERQAGLQELKPRLLEAIAVLPSEQRRAVELRVVDELEYAQVASPWAWCAAACSTPYAPATRGVCGELRRVGLLHSALTFTEPRLRTIVFGRALPGVRSVRIEGPGAPRDVRVADAGAFLLVYEGRVAGNTVRVSPR